MAWTTPRTYVSGEILTAAILNTHVRDNENALLGPFWFYIDGQSIRPDLTSGCDAPTDQTTTASNPLIMGCGFSGTADNYAQFKIPFPKSWNAGTVTFRIRWTSPNAGSGDVQWRLEGIARSDGESIDAAFGGTIAVVDTFQGVKIHHVSPTSAALTIGSTPTKQDMVYFRLWRNATNGSDTKTDKVYLEGVEVFLTMDTVNDA
jgi:hypothetical protein